MNDANKWRGWLAAACVLTAACGLAVPAAVAQDQGGPPAGDEARKSPKPDFPPFKEVSDGFEKVVSTADGESFYNLWVRNKDGQMLAELPRAFANQRHFIAMTVAGGETYAGLQSGDHYVYWKRFDKRLALMAPSIAVRSTGDQESKSSVQNIFTDRVILDVPILCMGPNGGPVIDMDDLLVGNATKFFNPRSAGGINARLATIAKAKAFPHNIEIAFEAPVATGVMRTFHYSISLIRDNPAYKPRVADERVGFFTTSYTDLGKFTDNEKYVRYVNRWHLEKADPKLRLSPPKEPIVFYVEHTTPVRYRRWVKDGAQHWNKAFERIGIRDAIEIHFQDKATGAHMDKDPEDVRYNFIRWLSNDQGTAIGPSRVHPLTGQILDADVVLTDGWIRHFWFQYKQYLPEVALEGFGPDALAWLEQNPDWDPRVRMLPPAERDMLLAQRARRGILAYGGHPVAHADPQVMGENQYDGLVGRVSQTNGMCMAATGKAFDVAMMRMNFEIIGMLDEESREDGDSAADEGDLLDGIPDTFIGPMLADLVAHEVGHTLGLRHNFKASGAYSLAQINSPEFKGAKAHTGSVMDYNPVNINMDDGEVQGDWTMINIGPYDLWAIEYGYTFESDLKPILARVAEPELAYLTDEDTWGPDPLARRYDFSASPIDFAKSRMKLAKYHRERILEKFVKEGESWSKARRGYEITLGMQVGSLSMMSRWVGGASVNRDRKGDPNGRAPIEVVDAARQRDALRWCIENAFHDESFGLTPDLLARMTVDKWWDAGGSIMDDPTWPVHDRIMGIQVSVLTMLMNPVTLQRVFDNEFRVPAAQDALTLPELIDTLSASIWAELDKRTDKTYTAREPMISSLRRNLQREHMERLIDLSMGAASGAASKPIANLAIAKLRELQSKIGSLASASNIDPYSKAHLGEARLRIEKALDAQYIYGNRSRPGMGFLLFGAEPDPALDRRIP